MDYLPPFSEEFCNTPARRFLYLLCIPLCICLMILACMLLLPYVLFHTTFEWARGLVFWITTGRSREAKGRRMYDPTGRVHIESPTSTDSAINH